ncbi:MAG: DEAD/DEAH box helicase [Bacteroidia bacterium]|nr:DEAD/DEAH box helicase [Bacteroidia bacterium]
MSFASLGLPFAFQKVLKRQGFTTPYPIQEQAIPAILKERDVLGIARTGSGKTASYVLPVLTNLVDAPENPNRHAHVLVLVPTRELAVQVSQVFTLFADALLRKVKCVPVYGGVAINPQMRALNRVSVLVATPGRLIELAEAKAVNLSMIQALVLDEADKMLDLGFQDEMTHIFKLLPPRRQNLLFSATLSEKVEKINELILHNPLVIKVDDPAEKEDQIEEMAYAVAEDKKGILLRHLLKTNDWKQVLVFTASGKKADNVANKLIKHGIEAAPMHSKKSQTARSEALRKFKAGELRVLVATDLLSRGIDIEFLPCVINYELPRSPKDYTHRIGRTGRADQSGIAISLISPEDQHHFRVILKKRGKWVSLIPTDEMELK